MSTTVPPADAAPDRDAGGRARRRRLALFLVALPWPFLAGLYAAGGWPWQPTPFDLDVYLQAAHRFLVGEPIYPQPEPALPMIYPPVAALLAVPLQLSGAAAPAIWSLINSALVVAVFLRIGLHGWHAPMVATVAIGLGGPINQVFFLGQVGIALMAMCILDLAPGPTLISRLGAWLPDRVRLPEKLLPVGTLVGVATAIKLTPALFIVALVLLGRHRGAVVATVSALVATGVGFVVRPAESLDYWLGIATGDFPGAADSAYQITNQSLAAIGARFLAVAERPIWLTLAGGLLPVLLCLLAAVVVHRAGEPMLALLLVGLGSTVAAPISWTHAYTWLAPIAVLVLLRPVGEWVRLLAVLTWAWFAFEPFQDLNTDTEVGLRLSLPAQAATAAGALLSLLLLVVAWAWARTARPARVPPPADLGPLTTEGRKLR
ncbi:glycosyltransferase family 87 protein [Naumannella halotolerans]|uniref:Alpha-1,2-mannosyltransferase n=1 Tax=Naumannella halotolerans TaxID=993414 RepID=A0A4R7JCN5_9ACTN|nr:glycosyltransferase family 87 protein [Naumannella halotolerans]TDT34433.1 alpha-1,2-mannosyltransferase [Naumannella halotolerans]